MRSVGDLSRWWSEGEQVSLPLGRQRAQRLPGAARRGPGDDAAARVPELLARLGQGRARAGRAAYAAGSRTSSASGPRRSRSSIATRCTSRPISIERLWEREGVDATILVAHDYGVSVAQELLARAAEGALEVELEAVHLLNGGLYPELHRPQPVQTALLDPEQGPRISELVTEELFIAGLAPTFAPGYDAAADSADIWAATSRGGGERIGHLLIRYIADRERHGARWTAALEQTGVPLGFVWGMLDPVSGAHMAERIRERLPDAPFLALDDVAHWPPLEAPERVSAALLG